MAPGVVVELQTKRCLLLAGALDGLGHRLHGLQQELIGETSVRQTLGRGE